MHELADRSLSNKPVGGRQRRYESYFQHQLKGQEANLTPMPTSGGGLMINSTAHNTHERIMPMTPISYQGAITSHSGTAGGYTNVSSPLRILSPSQGTEGGNAGGLSGVMGAGFAGASG